MHLLSKPTKTIDRHGAGVAANDGWLAAISRLEPSEACTKVGSTPEGLSATEAATRLKKLGPNLVARER
ncbi:MAG: cation-transporting P-type ATPase, partial [Bradyrhizobium sp.]|nr:cation-transporting P-type ATPase [Bradyrhizobium sp.]